MIFVDTGVFVAYINKRDKNHERAVKIFEDILRGKYGKAYTST
jgi:predicted nucleic acid-binding protein